MWLAWLWLCVRWGVKKQKDLFDFVTSSIYVETKTNQMRICLHSYLFSPVRVYDEKCTKTRFVHLKTCVLCAWVWVSTRQILTELSTWLLVINKYGEVIMWWLMSSMIFIRWWNGINCIAWWWELCTIFFGYVSKKNTVIL